LVVGECGGLWLGGELSSSFVGGLLTGILLYRDWLEWEVRHVFAGGGGRGDFCLFSFACAAGKWRLGEIC
jgi:hypothetical protein